MLSKQTPSKRNKWRDCLLISSSLLSLLYGMHAQALPSDQDEKIYITSGPADFNRDTGVAIYREDVVIDMGTTHVTGEVVTMQVDANSKLQEAIVEGTAHKQAHYQTLPEAGKALLHADADLIKYYPQAHRVLLQGHAQIKQGPDIINGEKLEYDTEKQRLKSLDVQDNLGHHTRTTIVIEPNSMKNLPAQKPKNNKATS